ncbi:MAG: Gfo/Idh/MocA family oxidoreductase [Bacteroidota bacterium]
MTTSSKTKVGVIGVGRLGTVHAKMYHELDSAELVGAYDIDPSRCDPVAKELGVRVFPTLDELLASVEAVSIATPTVTHHAIASSVIERGLHAFIEKPITSTVDEVQKLIRAADARKVKVQVGHIERFNPALLALEKYHLAPMFVECHRLAQFNPRGTDVAVVLDLMIHDIDIILSLVQSPVEKVDASGVAVVSDSVDIANARIEFANGCVANVTASRISQRKMRKMRLFQRDAYISIDFSEGLAEVFRLVDDTDPAADKTMLLGEIGEGKYKRKIVFEQPEVKEVNALKVELDSFLRSIRDDREPVVTARDGLRALQVADEILQKIKNQSIRVS